MGHMKGEGHLGRCYLKVAPAMLPTPSLPRSATICAWSWPWLRIIFRVMLFAMFQSFASRLVVKSAF